MKTSFVAETTPATAQAGNVGVFNPSENAHGLASSCAASVGLISTVPVRRPFTALMLLPKVIIGVLLPAAVKTSELKSLPIPFVEMSKQSGTNALPLLGPSVNRNE